MKRIDDLKAGVAVIILNEENQVLLQKRSDVGLWGIPSGHIDIRIKELIGVYSEPDSQVFTYPNGRVVHFITTCFLAEITGGELRCNSSESQEIQFFEQQSLPRDLLKMHPQWLNDALANDDLAFIR